MFDKIVVGSKLFMAHNKYIIKLYLIKKIMVLIWYNEC